MATSQSNTTPVCDVSILKTKYVDLVKHVVPQNVIPALKPFLQYTQLDAINAQKGRDEKVGTLLDTIQRQVNGNEYKAFDAFFLALAGTQHELFEAVCGREPTVTESDFCVQEVAQVLKTTIDNSSHCTDSELDEPICFQYEYVELSMVDNTQEDQQLDDHGGLLPHEYGCHLDQVCGWNRNISAQDLLGNEDRPHRKVSVYGRGGIGKSTTFQFLAKQWALGRWAVGFTMLFLLQLRFITTQVIAISTIELLQLYGLYDFPEQSDPTLFTSWLKNCTSRILVLIDGLDEIPGFAERMRNTPRIHDVFQRAHPVDLVINILRGDLLPGCTVISASRPFAGLSHLPTDAKAEILGFSSAKVTEYVERRHPHHLDNIMSVLSKNPVLLSICSITFYCMLITRLLSEGVIILDEDVATYSRLMAFVVVNYCSRRLTDSSFLMDATSYFPKLAQLAYSGMFELEGNTGLAKVVFDEGDLIRSEISGEDLEKMKRTGVIQVTRRKIGRLDSWAAEFFHLSAQELLAVAHLLSHPPFPDRELTQLFHSGQFNLALQFIFGLHFDKGNSSINEIRTAVCRRFESEGIESELSSYIDSILDQKVQVCQLIHEGQWDEKAREVVNHIAPDGKLAIKDTTLTAIDLLAVDYVCQMNALSSISLQRVHADASFVDLLLSSLCGHHWGTLQELNLRDNSIGDAGVQSIADGLHDMDCESVRNVPMLRTLNIAGNKIGDEGAKSLSRMLANNDQLQKLDIGDNQIGQEGVTAMANALSQNSGLKVFQVNHSNASGSAAAAIADMLQHNTCLEGLDLSRSRLRDDEINVLASSLHRNTSLTKLDLHSNKIGNIGARAIATMLSHNSRLQQLDISRNHMGDDAARYISAGLRENTSLVFLDMSWSNVRYDGRRVLADVQRPNLEINVYNNNYGNSFF